MGNPSTLLLLAGLASCQTTIPIHSGACRNDDLRCERAGGRRTSEAVIDLGDGHIVAWDERYAGAVPTFDELEVARLQFAGTGGFATRMNVFAGATVPFDYLFLQIDVASRRFADGNEVGPMLRVYLLPTSAAVALRSIVAHLEPAADQAKLQRAGKQPAVVGRFHGYRVTVYAHEYDVGALFEVDYLALDSAEGSVLILGVVPTESLERTQYDTVLHALVDDLG